MRKQEEPRVHFYARVVFMRHAFCMCAYPPPCLWSLCPCLYMECGANVHVHMSMSVPGALLALFLKKKLTSSIKKKKGSVREAICTNCTLHHYARMYICMYPCPYRHASVFLILLVSSWQCAHVRAGLAYVHVQPLTLHRVPLGPYRAPLSHGMIRG